VVLMNSSSIKIFSYSKALSINILYLFLYVSCHYKEVFMTYSYQYSGPQCNNQTDPRHDVKLLSYTQSKPSQL
jgi:hypothetical protein